jgi:hypothetical protein
MNLKHVKMFYTDKLSVTYVFRKGVLMYECCEEWLGRSI